MSVTLPPRLQPPANDPPVADDGRHSDAWTGFHQNVADRLDSITQKVMAKAGVTDGSEATAGQIGEFMTASAGGVGLSDNVVTNVVSLDLTAGDWDVSGNVGLATGSGTHVTFAVGIDSIDTQIMATFPTGGINQVMNTATRRYNGTATVTVWLVALAAGSSSATASGSIRARRAR
jgi:hypothetical protein